MTSITRFTTAIVTSAVLLLPAVAAAQFGVQYTSPNFSFSYGTGAGFNCGANNICQVASTIIFVINYVLVPVLFALAFIVFLWGVAKAYIFSGGEEEARKKGHQLILWGIIAFVVMISLWGLVNIVANTFGLGGYYAPPTPTSTGLPY